MNQQRRRREQQQRQRRRNRFVPPPPPPPLPIAVTLPAAATTAADADALASRCDAIELNPPPECRRPLPCDLRAFDPGPRFNAFVTAGRYGKSRKWAENNVDPANRHFQNGVEWWVHRALAHTAQISASKASAEESQPATPAFHLSRPCSRRYFASR